MDLRKTLLQSRKLPAQHIETLWENIYKNNVKVDTLTSILVFYMHHRIYPPPVQRAFDTLLIAFTGSKVPKKMRTLLFQTVEEMCHWLNPLCIKETVKLSTSPAVVAELLPCFLTNKDIPLPDNAAFEWMINSLTSPGLTLEDRVKILSFLMQTVPLVLQPTLNKQLISWLSYSRTSTTSGSLFRSPDVTELDGSPSLGICTALTLVASVTDLQYLSLSTFSNIRRYLYHSRECADSNLMNAVFSYCSTLLTQAAKKPSNQQDKQLISVVLEEVMLVLGAVREIDSSCSGRCQLMVGNVQLLAEQLRLTNLLISVWDYQLTLGEESSLTQKVLGSVIKSEFSQGAVSHKVASVVEAHSSKLSHSLSKFAPNLLKLVATHPSALVEEFVEIIPHLASDNELIVEVLHSLLDLPTLSASICIHQSSLLVQAGIKVPVLLSVKQQVEVDHKTVYSHLMRTQTKSGETEALLNLYSGFYTALRPILSLGLIDVCSQVTPILLDTFLESASSNQKSNSLVLSALLSRIPVLCPLPKYQNAIFDILPKYIIKVCQSQPQLIEITDIAQFISITSHAQLCPQVLESIIKSVGEHVRTEQVIVDYFETLDALLRELLLEKFTIDLSLENSICTTLAKLASRNLSLIPRAITTFDKLVQTLQNSPEEREEDELEGLLKHVKELLRILKNPRLANVVLSPSSKEDQAMAAVARVLFHFLD